MIWLKRCWVPFVASLAMCALLTACQSTSKEPEPVEEPAAPEGDAAPSPQTSGPAADQSASDPGDARAQNPGAQAIPLPSLDVATRFPTTQNVLGANAAARLLPDRVVWVAVLGGKAFASMGLFPEAEDKLLAALAGATTLPSDQIQAALGSLNGTLGFARTEDGTGIVFAELQDPNAVMALFETFTGVPSEPESTVPDVILARGGEHRLVIVDKYAFVLTPLGNKAVPGEVARAFGQAPTLGDQPRFTDAMQRLQRGALAALWVDVERMRDQAIGPIEDKLTKIDRAMQADNGGGESDPRIGMKKQFAGIRTGLDAVWGDVTTITVAIDGNADGLAVVADVALTEASNLQTVEQHLPLLSVWTEPVAMSFRLKPNQLTRLGASVFPFVSEPALRAHIGDLGLNVDEDVLSALTGQVAVGFAPVFHPLLADIALPGFDSALTLELRRDAPIDDVWNAVSTGLAARPDSTVSDDGNHVQIVIEDAATLNIERVGNAISIWSGPLGAEARAGESVRLAADGVRTGHQGLDAFDGMLGRIDVQPGGLGGSASVLRPDARDAICRPNNRTLVATDPAAGDAYCALLDEVRALATGDADRRNAAADKLMDGVVFHLTLTSDGAQSLRAYGGVYTGGQPIGTLFEAYLDALPVPGDADYDALYVKLEQLFAARNALELERN